VILTHPTYDALGPVLTKTAKYGTASPETTTYSYDQDRTGYYNVGHQTTAANAAAVIVYNFDQEGRQVGQTYTVGTSTTTASPPASTPAAACCGRAIRTATAPVRPRTPSPTMPPAA
jgi:hypothetical protein